MPFIKTNLLNNKLRCATGILALSLVSSIVHALPSFSRQTGESCTACHVQTWGTSLTPRGREFKLRGYSEGDTQSNWKLPLSMVISGGGDFDQTEYPKYISYTSYQPRNSGFVDGSIFYAGKIYKHLGAYVEGSGAYRSTGGSIGYLNKVDLRFANQAVLPGHTIDYGISINNEPGVQDLWNTNSVWRQFNYATGGYEFSIAPLADRGLSGQVAGATLYAMINNLLYIEAGGYGSLPKDIKKGIGRGNDYVDTQISGAAPYWRVALQHNWAGHYVSLGHFGLIADIREQYSNNMLGNNPNHERQVSYSDLGVDATYQYLANPDHIFEVKASYITETKSGYYTSYSYDYSGGINYYFYKYKTTTDSFNVSTAYTWQQTLGLMVGFQHYTVGSQPDDIQLLNTELSYTPFGKQHSLAAPWLNLRVNLGYVTNISSNSDPGYFYSRYEMLYLKGQIAF